VGNGRGRVAAKNVAEQSFRSIEVGLLQVCETRVEYGHVVCRINRKDTVKLRDALIGMAAVYQNETQVVAGVEVSARW
jgi:hypothetical protein